MDKLPPQDAPRVSPLHRNPPIRVSRVSPLPLHYQISEQLRHEIASGRYETGQPLPSEAELMGRFGVARGTIRQALASLRADGSISGSRGRPPTVRGTRLVQPFTELLSFSAWVRSLGREPGGTVIEFVRRPAEVEIADALGVRQGDAVFSLVRVRLADGEPLMIERTVFPERIGVLVGKLELDRQSIYAELEEQGIVFESAHQTVDAVGASAADARLLAVPTRTPLLRVRRLSYSPAGDPLEWSEDRYLSERVVLTIDNSATRPALARRLTGTGGT